jgi:succinate dehydrogenase / fumarate reductase iron-sulfur subunit
MSEQQAIKFSIRRFLPEKDSAPHWESYDIETIPGMTVLEGLHRVREQCDPTLAWRYSCRMGTCGSCAMIINGQPALACSTQVRHVDDEHIRLEALWNFSIVKDLVTDLSPTLAQHRRHKPWVIRPDAEAIQETEQELRQTPAELLDYMQFAHCIKCCACVAACPTAAMNRDFHGPLSLTATHRYNADSRDDGFAARKDVVTEPYGVAHCHYAGECSRVCPKGVDPARAIQLMKRDLVMDLFRSVRPAPAQPVAPAASSGQREPSDPQAPAFTVPDLSRQHDVSKTENTDDQQ